MWNALNRICSLAQSGLCRCRWFRLLNCCREQSRQDQVGKETTMSNDNFNFFKSRKPSKRSRRGTLKSSASSRSFYPNDTLDSWAFCESTLERELLTIVLVHPSVVGVQEQPEAVTYIDDDGKERTHTFDFRIRLCDGRTIVVDVKADSRRLKSGIDEVHRLIQEQHPGYADKFIVRTDREISRDGVRNAELILRARTLWDEEAIEELRRHLASMHGVFRLASLVALFDSEAAGFNAVLNLIDAQELKPVTRGRINDNTELEICKAA
ncbi:hypothetical protein SIAM614_15552 [Stappia aggregata IAM 12614]|uniref:TnsA endonuclease N-terminal domain-containing protein n=2 Tax=Roseibium aggregatum TaxID=187304 RepID=A0NW57_ROSAI|nr:hypothetical protein SIAM614_15552 [Stappia aggregata IAM 12614] [Roseibium aggregatum IAM 12614]